jgi:hypothetical protein
LLLSTDTLQYNDYDRYESERFDKEAKAKRHAEVFPEDCKRAFELGVRMAIGRSARSGMPSTRASITWMRPGHTLRAQVNPCSGRR